MNMVIGKQAKEKKKKKKSGESDAEEECLNSMDPVIDPPFIIWIDLINQTAFWAIWIKAYRGSNLTLDGQDGLKDGSQF